MNNDEVVWQVVNNKFCSFKVKTVQQAFCRNEYNVTGLCNRGSCPLANSRYATVREIDAERAHSPAKLWEKIKLSKNLVQALAKIDEELIYWPNFMINRCKQRLTRIKQYLVKMRRLKLKNGPKLVTVNKKIERREASRELKAEAAAKLEKSIEKELLNRLKSKAYGDEPLNVNEDVWKAILEGDKLELEDELSEDEEDEEEEFEEEREYVEAESDDEDLEDMFTSGKMTQSNLGSSDDEYSSDQEDDSDQDSSDSDARPVKRKAPEPKPETKKSKKKRGSYVEIEYEEETMPMP